MKTLIFDIDDTLIKWHPEFIRALKSVLKDLHLDYPEDLIKKIDAAIDEHEKHYSTLTKENLVDFINKTCDINLPPTFADKIIIAQSDLVYEDEKLIKVIEYLSSKYKLYAISNWFTETQTNRLEKMGILKYFTKVYGADINYFKPNPHTFDIILNEFEPENCISIGDNLQNDVLLPLSLGMKAIWLDKKNMGTTSPNYQTIKSIYELKNIL